jgi:ATP-binding cassette subfamily B protein
MNDNKTGIPRLLEISAQKPRHLLFAIIFSSISGILQFAPYFSAFKVIEIAALNYGALNGEHIRRIMDWAIAGVVCVGGGFVFMYAGSLCSHLAAFRILYGLRMSLAKKLTELPMGFHLENSTGKIQKILEFNVEQTEQWIAHALPDYVSGIGGFFVILILLFGVNIWLTLVFFVVVIAGVFIATRFSTGEKGMNKLRRYQNSLERINASTVQYVNGMPAVKIFNRSAESFQSLKKDIYDYQNLAIEHTKEFRPIYTILSSLLKGIALFILPVAALLLKLSPASLNYAFGICMFLILAPGIVAPIFKVVGIGSIVKRITTGVERIDMIFNTPPLSEPETGVIPKKFDVRFSGVRFSYNPKDETPVFAVDGVSFSAEEGKITALIGPSGGGKSTIAQLVPRFWDIEYGDILIGGINIKGIKMEDLNTIVSFVFQDCFLFSDTIRENIRGGRVNATEEEIIAVAQAAQCHDFITALPNGYDTLIGEGGIYLSGGEEQRINIARAILKNTPVLVLDEATAFADSENEALLYRAIKSLIQNKTVIMIAHRLSTVMNADNIIVMDNGKILEEGTHNSLVKAGGLYTELYSAYTKSAEWTVSGRDGIQ